MIKEYTLPDKTDLRLIAELDENSRQPISRIARRLRINQNTLQFRLKRLIEEKVILGFYPSIDVSKLGYIAFRVYFNFINTDPLEEEKILNELIKENICTIVAELEANYDAMFMATVKNIQEFYHFWNQFKSKYRKFIENEQISIISRVDHFKRNYLSDIPRKGAESVGQSNQIKIDEGDKKILSFLVKNSRMSALEISAKTQIPPRTVIHKIKQLEKKRIILGYRVNINLNKISYQYFKLNIKLSNTNQIKELEAYCKQNRNVIFIDYTISDWDFELDLEVENKQKLVEFVKSLKTKFPIFKKIEIITFSKYHKIETIPTQ
ncbi:Lrp/AsnC family transcriptional regulator [Candidatus Pacearchaeota archaeon]|nr:Lrp/AsnC family transcriptional regulator [Candidatus Pacearchaeota archaeon]